MTQENALRGVRVSHAAINNSVQAGLLTNSQTELLPGVSGHYYEHYEPNNEGWVTVVINGLVYFPIKLIKMGYRCGVVLLFKDPDNKPFKSFKPSNINQMEIR